MTMPAAGSHRILIVEDDSAIADVIATYLSDCGFDVVVANSADRAIETMTSDRVVDLVFSDITMPGSMDGIGLARWIRERRPDIKVLLTSGLVNRVEELQALCDEGPIAKPYKQEVVAERIRYHLGAVVSEPNL